MKIFTSFFPSFLVLLCYKLGVERWRDEEVERWSGGGVDRWRDREVEGWTGGGVERWRSREVEGWRDGGNIL